MVGSNYLDISLLFRILLVSLLWGVSNPQLNLQSKAKTLKNDTDEKKIIKSLYSPINIIKETINLFLNWRFTLFYLINQLGSLLYISLLSSTLGLSLIIPVTNSLTLCITFMVEYFFYYDKNRRNNLNYNSLLGIILILIGITVALTG